MKNIEKEIQGANNIQLLTTLYAYQNSQSKSKRITADLVKKELEQRGVIL